LGEGKQFMRRCSRFVFFFVILLAGLPLPVTGLEDATLAATIWDPLATADDPDGDPGSSTDHATSLNTDSLLPPPRWFGATLARLRHVPSCRGYGTPQSPTLSFRIPRAPPVS
jgi:hypothetical protein